MALKAAHVVALFLGISRQFALAGTAACLTDVHRLIFNYSYSMLMALQEANHKGAKY